MNYRITHIKPLFQCLASAIICGFVLNLYQTYFEFAEKYVAVFLPYLFTGMFVLMLFVGAIMLGLYHLLCIILDAKDISIGTPSRDSSSNENK